MKTNVFAYLESLEDETIIAAFKSFNPNEIPARQGAKKHYFPLGGYNYPVKHIIKLALKIQLTLGKKNLSDSGKEERITDFINSVQKTDLFIEKRIKPLEQRILQALKQKSESQNRLFRMTWNEYRWEMPSRHPWNKENQGNTNVAYENQYGYGFEEWTFNPRYQLDGYQYGYLRGAEIIDADIEIIDKALLFSIDPNGQRFIVGEIKNMEIISEYPKEQNKAKKLFLKYFSEMVDELKSTDADYKDFKKEKISPNIKFKMQDAIIYDEKIPAPELNGRRWNRFNPYKIEGDLKEIIDTKLAFEKFVFNNGIASNKVAFTRTVIGSKGEISRMHSKITNDLCAYLNGEYSVKQNNISVEKTLFGPNIADVVLSHGGEEYSIIEVKTSSNARKNIREALGQLIDYSFWYDTIKVREIIIVGPTSLNAVETVYLNRVKKALKIKLSYWHWLGEMGNGKERINKLV